jgi:hypothetical protein
MAQIPMGGAGSSHLASGHSGVFNLLRELRSVDVGLADECLRAAAGHTSARKETPSSPRR